MTQGVGEVAAGLWDAAAFAARPRGTFGKLSSMNLTREQPSLADPFRTFGRWCGVIFLLIACGSVVADASATPARLIPSAENGWPQFRGLRRDGISDERGLLQQWPETGLRVAWSITNVGRGFSSPVISGGRLVVTGDFAEHLVLLAFDLAGQPVWRATNGASWKTPYPGARATATFSGGRLYHENAHGRVVCLDPADGRIAWAVDVLKDFGGSNITWGMSECLLVDERAVFVTAGGREALVVALSKTNGAVLWRSPPLYDSAGEKTLENASYVSPILVQLGERRLLIGASLRHLYCVDADTGALQWTQPVRTAHSVLAMMPVLVGNAVFMTAPHGPGGRLWTLKEAGGKVTSEGLWETVLDTCQGGAVYRDGKIFGSFYPGRKGWAAIDANTGRVLYQTADFVKGAVLYADQRLYVLSEDGWMWLLEATNDEFAVRGKFQFANAKSRDAWAHPVILDGRLYLRYHDTLTCYDVKR
jgi:outer membrane protein assembly factor BamB